MAVSFRGERPRTGGTEEKLETRRGEDARSTHAHGNSFRGDKRQRSLLGRYAFSQRYTRIINARRVCPSARSVSCSRTSENAKSDPRDQPMNYYVVIYRLNEMIEARRRRTLFPDRLFAKSSARRFGNNRKQLAARNCVFLDFEDLHHTRVVNKVGQAASSEGLSR